MAAVRTLRRSPEHPVDEEHLAEQRESAFQPRFREVRIPLRVRHHVGLPRRRPRDRLAQRPANERKGAARCIQKRQRLIRCSDLRLDFKEVVQFEMKFCKYVNRVKALDLF